jgi:hypothetical protein
MAENEIPEVRQCQDVGHWQFGSVAVKAGENRWGIMNPMPPSNPSGGHWGDDEEVKDWKTMVSQ